MSSAPRTKYPDFPLCSVIYLSAKLPTFSILVSDWSSISHSSTNDKFPPSTFIRQRFFSPQPSRWLASSKASMIGSFAFFGMKRLLSYFFLALSPSDLPRPAGRPCPHSNTVDTISSVDMVGTKSVQGDGDGRDHDRITKRRQDFAAPSIGSM